MTKSLINILASAIWSFMTYGMVGILAGVSIFGAASLISSFI
ncbi:hypothetical protein D521_0444 [beta proteobacterium CB]|nr:hypothetical protein D521_0444 [beta proteobacterium CB]